MWITSFLSNRFQRVAVNNSYSDWKPVTSGVPQGSVLGPLLFAIYVNDMPSVVSSKLFKFADDTKLYRTISSPLDIQTLQNDLDLLYNWSIDWLLRFNISKCKAMQIGRFTSDDYTYFINNQPLPTVELEKDLGVFVDDTVSTTRGHNYKIFKPHSQCLTRSIFFSNRDQ